MQIDSRVLTGVATGALGALTGSLVALYAARKARPIEQHVQVFTNKRITPRDVQEYAHEDEIFEMEWDIPAQQVAATYFAYGWPLDTGRGVMNPPREIDILGLAADLTYSVMMDPEPQAAAFSGRLLAEKNEEIDGDVQVYLQVGTVRRAAGYTEPLMMEIADEGDDE